MNQTPSETSPIKTDKKTVTIQAGTSLSDAVDLVAGTPVKLRMPATWDAAPITFQESFDGSDFNDFFDTAGVEVEIVVAANRTIKLDPADFVGIRFLKIRSGTSALPVNQVAPAPIDVIRTVL